MVAVRFGEAAIDCGVLDLLHAALISEADETVFSDGELVARGVLGYAGHGMQARPFECENGTNEDRVTPVRPRVSSAMDRVRRIHVPWRQRVRTKRRVARARAGVDRGVKSAGAWTWTGVNRGMKSAGAAMAGTEVINVHRITRGIQSGNRGLSFGLDSLIVWSVS